MITSDHAVRGGKVIPLKETVDEAIQGLDSVKRVYVASRTGENVNMEKDRDVQLQEVSYCTSLCLVLLTMSTQKFHSHKNTPLNQGIS